MHSRQSITSRSDSQYCVQLFQTCTSASSLQQSERFGMRSSQLNWQYGCETLAWFPNAGATLGLQTPGSAVGIVAMEEIERCIDPVAEAGKPVWSEEAAEVIVMMFDEASVMVSSDAGKW